MIERPMIPEDVTSVTELHRACGLEYELPDLNCRSMLVKHVIEDEGKVPMAALVRMTAEMYLLVDAKWRSPAWRSQAFSRLEHGVEERLSHLYLQSTAHPFESARHVEDECCWMPPVLEKSFGRRLMRYGWLKNEWPTYSRRRV